MLYSIRYDYLSRNTPDSIIISALLKIYIFFLIPFFFFLVTQAYIPIQITVPVKAVRKYMPLASF